LDISETVPSRQRIGGNGDTRPDKGGAAAGAGASAGGSGGGSGSGSGGGGWDGAAGGGTVGGARGGATGWRPAAVHSGAVIMLSRRGGDGGPPLPAANLATSAGSSGSSGAIFDPGPALPPLVLVLVVAVL
jgi:hypothetical protein